jgi:hypothetical protein
MNYGQLCVLGPIGNMFNGGGEHLLNKKKTSGATTAFTICPPGFVAGGETMPLVVYGGSTTIA